MAEIRPPIVRRLSKMSYDYEAKARADFAASKKDERLYAITEKHGEDYRRGWRLARLASEMPPPAEPVAPLLTPPPPTHEDRRLAIGEDKPVKPTTQPAAPNPQMDLFS